MDARLIKAHEIASYDLCAAAYTRTWAKHTENIAGGLVDLIKPASHDFCIDIAGGTGAAGLQVASRIGPSGRVLITDLSPAMVQEARLQADMRTLENVDTAVMDAEALTAADGTFSLAISTFGLMFVPDIRRASAEIARVLQQGGRVAIAVWSTLDRVPAIRLQLDAFRNVSLESTVRDGFLPDRFGQEGELEEALESAGFVDIRTELRTFQATFSSVSEYVDVTFEGTPLAHALQELSTNAAASVVAWLRDHCEQSDDGSVIFNNEVRFITATTERFQNDH